MSSSLRASKISTVCFVAWLFLLVARAFGGSGPSSDYLIDVWTSDDGLPDSSVTSVAQTPDGYLWVGTYNGLARFDGVRFVNSDPFTTPALKHPRIFGLWVDGQGTLWINTYDGSMTSMRDGTFTDEWQGGQVSAVFSQSNRVFFALLRGELVFREQNSSGTNAWHAIRLAGSTTGNSFRQDRSGALWCLLRNGGICRVMGTNSERIASTDAFNVDRARSLAIDRFGRVWVATDKQIGLWNRNHFEDQTPDEGVFDENIRFIFPAATNGIWALTDDGVRVVAGRKWSRKVESWRDLSQVDVAYLGAYEDQEGGTWFRHYGQGLFHAKPDGAVERISAQSGLPGDRVGCWFQDQEGSIWVGVDRGGLVRLRKKRVQLIGAAEGLTVPAVSSVCEDSGGALWIGTFGGGLNRWRDNVLTRFNLPEGANKGSFFSIYADKQDKLWLSAGREDLYMMDGERVVDPATAVHAIKVLFVDRRGRIWMGRHYGLACLEDGVLTNFGNREGLGREDVRAIAEDRDGHLWVGTADGDLFEFDGATFKSRNINDGFPRQAIWSLLVDDDGALWVGTFRGGLLRYRQGAFKRYTSQQGLPSDIICQILDDGMGKLWVGSHKGIFSIAKESVDALDRNQIDSLTCASYGLYDGLPTLECSGSYQPSCWRAKDGRLWFATVKGLVAVQPNEIALNHLAPPVIVEDILVDGKSFLQPADRSKTVLSIQVPPGKHQFDFHYTALSYLAPDKVRFRYRVLGQDEVWVDSGTKRFAHCGPLRPGQYGFQVIACNNDGVWNEQGAVLNFRVLPYVWQTWWFQTGIGVVVLGSGFSVLRIVATRNLQRKLEQLKHQHAIERDRERIARDIHDDLGAGLTQIVLQSAIAQREPPEHVRTHLSQISDTARDLVRTMDEIVWAVNPENDTLDGLVTYVGKFAQEYVTAAGIRCRLDLPVQLPSVVLSAETRHNLFLAIKEALNNAVKHARASEIFFQLEVEPAAFTFVVRDNGCGLEKNRLKTDAAGDRIAGGNGLRNIQDRLKQIGGSSSISSETGQGTEVRLTVMIQQPSEDRSEV